MPIYNSNPDLWNFESKICGTRIVHSSQTVSLHHITWDINNIKFLGFFIFNISDLF